MSEYRLAGAASIVGVGASPFGRFADRSPISLGAESLRHALQDAGLALSDVDGLMVNMGYPVGIDYDQFCEATGLHTVVNLQTWTHGRWVGQLVELAAATVAAGLARCVALVGVAKFTVHRQIGGAEDIEAYREGGGSHGELPHLGLASPASGAAMAASVYVNRYGIDPDEIGSVAIRSREAARRNPGAFRTEPLDADRYRDSRFIIEPLRVHDFAQVTDGACTILVMAAEDATETRRPVPILATQGIPGGREQFIFGRPGLGVRQQPMEPFTPSPRDLEIYARAGVSRDDVDGLYVYDAFAPLIWFSLERYGFCGEGEAPAFVAAGELPFNTHGGLLAEAHVSGWNHIVEMARQARGEAGERQLEATELLQWGGSFGDSFLIGKASA